MSDLPQPSRERLIQLFLALARIPSPSRSERKVADAVVALLQGLGLTVHEDATGKAIGGDCGNLWCVAGDVDSKPCLALGAHLDTVTPGDPIEPVLGGDGLFRNAGEGILGADDKAAIAALVHATELLVAGEAPFPTFELFFTVGEEQGLVGIKHLSADILRSPMAAVLDSSGPVGGIVVKAPSQQIVRAKFKGLAAHAGVEPEKGRSAIAAAAKAITAMRLGRLDDETTANIGIISGGVATNVVPEICEIEGECRSLVEDKLTDVAANMVDAIQMAATEVGADVEVSLVQEFRSFALDEKMPVVRLGKAAIAAIGLTPRLLTAGGGSDANVLNERGVPTINLDSGMMRVHSPDEYLALDELERLCRVVLQMIALAGAEADGRRSDL